MPIYEYKSQGCGEKLELLQRMNETPVCKNCGSEDLTKPISTPAHLIMGENNNLGDSGSCCGLTNPCSDPKRCCGI